MRKFTTLFLLMLAMTIGASQAFAQENDPNDPDTIDRPDPRNDRPGDDPDDDDDDEDKEDPVAMNSVAKDHRCENFAAAVLDCPPPRRRKPKLVVIKKEPEDCGCKHKTVRVGARFVTIVDCYYQAINVNGRAQLRYCPKDN